MSTALQAFSGPLFSLIRRSLCPANLSFNKKLHFHSVTDLSKHIPDEKVLFKGLHPCNFLSCSRPMQNGQATLPDFMTNPNAVMDDDVAWRDREPPRYSATRQKYLRGTSCLVRAQITQLATLATPQSQISQIRVPNKCEARHQQSHLAAFTCRAIECMAGWFLGRSCDKPHQQLEEGDLSQGQVRGLADCQC